MQNINNIKLSKEQKNCVEFDENKDLLVRGYAGSGKSLVILKRALKTAKKHLGEDIHIVIYTYTKALANDTREKVNLFPDLKKSIKVMNTDKIWKDLYERYYTDKNPQWIYYKKSKYNPLYRMLEETINSIKERANNRFLESEMFDFVYDEISWIKQHSDSIKKRADYLECTRSGRGRSIIPTKDDRDVLYSIYIKYFNLMKDNNFIDVNSACAEMSQHLEKIPDKIKYDYVMVDECQDLSLSELNIIKSLARRSLTLCSDFNQKIYSNSGFTWSEFGIDLRRSNAKKLKGTFRNTKQIALLANSLKEHIQELDDDIDSDDILTDREGPIPLVHFMRSEEEEEESIIKLIKDIKKNNPEYTIGILFPTNYWINEFYKILQENGLEAEIINRTDLNNQDKSIKKHIKMSTYYSAKGLEFDDVIIPRVVSEIYPFKDKKGTEELNEYKADTCRNAFYVAMTRARFELHIYTDQTTRYSPSPFIYELDENYYERTSK